MNSVSSLSADILFIDDDLKAISTLISSLKKRASSVVFHTATDLKLAKTIIENNHPEVVILDLSLDPDIGPDSGIAAIDEIQDIDPSIRILVLTGHGSEKFGITAIKKGAASFIIKPADPNYLFALIIDAVNYARLKRDNVKLHGIANSSVRGRGLTSSSPAMKKVVEQAFYAATNNQPVFLCGATGTGKGVFSRAIHQMSSRANKPFIRVQPTFGSADLISSELFGHEKGAFTGAVEARSGLIEEANGGTLFIDEVDELPQETQVILLNVLQEKTYRRLGSNKSRHSDFRLIVATNMPLEQLVTSKKMREDFFHRVSHCIIKLPTLSQRQEDIESLSEQFLEDIVTRENLNVRGFSTGVAPRLLSYAWPGNIRELQATIESAAYRAAYQNKRLIEFEDFNLPKKSSSKSPTNALSFRERIDAFAVQLAEEALARNGNNQTKAAESLKLDRTSFRRILKHKRP